MMDAVLSHTAEGARPLLFVEDGTAIKFYVDPGSVLSRPKLIRTLKSAGASIASDPKTADFILVQSDSSTGQRFIRDWTAEKKVLEATWVSKTLAAGRLLKESDDWGGCLAVEDPSVDLEEQEQHHLPTPRITPVELAPNTWSSNGAPPPPQHRHSSQQPPGMNGHLFPNNVPPASLPNPDSQQSSQQPPGMNGHLFPNNVPPASLQQPFQPNQMPQFTQQPGIQQPFYYQPPTQYPSGLIVDPSVYSMVVMDILSNKGLLQGLLPSWPGPPPPHGPILQNGMQPGFFVPPMTNPPQMYSQMPAAYNQSASPPSVSGPLPQSLSRISSADIKGKGKGTSYASRDSSGSSRTLASSSVSVDKLFTSDSGEPLTFYVAIEVHNRNLTLNHIKRHGGQISTQMTANYAILSSRSKDFETLLETVLSSGGIPVKPAFVDESVEQGTLLDPSQYQFDVPAKLLRKVVPPSPAKSDAEKKAAANVRKAKARRAKKDAAVKAEKTSPGLSSQRVPSPSPPPEHTRVLHNGIKYRYPEVEDEYVLRYAAVLFERDRQMSYAALSAKLHAKMPHHSDKAWNNHISQTMRDDVENVRKRAIIAYRKEEHSRSNAEEPAAKRMKPSKPVDGPQAPADDPQTPANDPQAPAGDPQAPADDPQPAGDPQAKALADEEHDLNAVAHFFANGGDVEQTDGEDEEQSVKDARVWARLTEQTACRTEASWEVFYNKHHPRVMELYQMLAEEESPPQ